LKAILTATDVIRLLDLRPHPEGGHFRETFRDASLVFPVAQAERVRLGGPLQPRSTICSRAANARTGIAPTPPKSGTGTPARRSGSTSQRERKRASA
jgi:Cupin superfamily (DUF985)